MNSFILEYRRMEYWDVAGSNGFCGFRYEPQINADRRRWTHTACEPVRVRDHQRLSAFICGLSYATTKSVRIRDVENGRHYLYNANVNGDGIQETVCILKMIADICLETWCSLFCNIQSRKLCKKIVGYEKKYWHYELNTINKIIYRF